MADPIQRRFEPEELRDRLLDAAVAELRASGYAALTIRRVARRGGVSPATAYKVFSSKEHLIASVFLRFLQSLPDAGPDDDRPVEERLVGLVQDFAEALAAQPQLQEGLRAAFLGDDQDSQRVRTAMVEDFMLRFLRACGDDLAPEAHEVVMLSFAGAMLMAGAGLLPFDQIGPRMRSIVRMVDPAVVRVLDQPGRQKG